MNSFILLLRDRECKWGREAEAERERERDGKSQAGSMLNEEPNSGPDPTTPGS